MIINHPLKHSFLDYPSPDGVCTTVFIAGCDNSCEGCSNPQFKDHSPQLTKDNGFIRVDSHTLYKLISKSSSQCNSKKVVFIGGDPLSSHNYIETSKICKLLYEDSYEICIYTGLTREKLTTDRKYRAALQNNFTFIKTGLFLKEMFQKPCKTDSFMKFASKNQELLNNRYNCISQNGIYNF
jgi:organic radical activating enzyme